LYVDYQGFLMRFIATIVCAFVLAMLPAANICRATDPPPFHIQAHRSAGIAMPENTLESVQWAWQRGVTPHR